MSQAEKSIKVAISAEFLEAYSRISKSKQARVRSFIEKFKKHPTAPGLNYEKISDAQDQNLRSLRIDQQYRAIVLRPENGNVFMLLWVDNHDDAYDWARNRQFQVHPDTGAIQVVDVAERETQREEPEREQVGLFDEYRDRELVRLGVPEGILPAVRAIRSQQDLDESSSWLPEEAFEALFMLTAGFTKEEVFAEVVASEDSESIDTTDFAAALERADSLRRFTVVEDDLELQQILAAPLERWRIFLHPSQRKLVQMHANGPVRVLGGAGTGKTVVAMHRAKWLAEFVFTDPRDRILVTTFTKNLAIDIRENLQKLCAANTMRRIEVINIDAWVAQFLRQNGYDFQIAFEDRLRLLWENAINIADQALELPDEFYKDEWQQVIQQQGIDSMDAYIRADRTGRGQRLPRSSRPKVWAVFEEYRTQLNRHRFKELTDATRDARHLLEQQGDVFPYCAVVIDEAQDMSAEVFRLVRQMIPTEDGSAPNDIFIVGDAHQRIYGSRVVLGHCGIDIRGRGRKLRVNYRTTEETRQWAMTILRGRSFDDLDGGQDDQRGYRSLLHGADPEVQRHDSFSDEIEAITDYVATLQNQGVLAKDVCLIARTNDLVNQYDGALRSGGHETYLIRRSSAEDRRTDGIRLATMHRVKGLEFDYVIVAGVNEGIVPLPQAIRAEGAYEKEVNETRERSLLYVAVTRARQSVLITCTGKPSPFLPEC
jgi:superfamily I DNA/RNA helicase/mRNA-degrading endonuclease RelE of RelBE toxin-antitoxin system